MYTIYMHKNKINNKVYIGQTCQRPERRWRQGQGYKHCSYFYHAIQKYGWNGFQHIILKQNLTLEEANKYENQLIKQYNSTNPNFGYNLELGGTNKTHSEETKQKISNSLKGQMAGEKNPMYGKISPNAKKVKCIETGEIFSSATEAAKKYKVDSSGLSKCAKGKRPTCAGFHWRYI